MGPASLPVLLPAFLMILVIGNSPVFASSEDSQTLQMFYDEQRKIGETNLMFLFLVEEGMTREELERLITKRPALWGRFSNWLERLPNSVITVK